MLGSIRFDLHTSLLCNWYFFTDNNQEATDQVWINCPEGTSKIHVCTPMRDEIMQEISIDEETGDNLAIKWNGNDTWVETFNDAVTVCKQLCNENTTCNSFNIRRIEFGAGYTCTFYQSMLDNKHCLGVPGGMPDVETTYMKDGIGRCEQFSEKQNKFEEKRQIENHGKEKPLEPKRKEDVRLTIESCCSLN